MLTLHPLIVLTLTFAGLARVGAPALHAQSLANEGEVSFFFDKERVARGGQYLFKKFKLVTVGD